MPPGGGGRAHAAWIQGPVRDCQMKQASVSETRDGPGDEQAMVELLRRGVAAPPRVPLNVQRQRFLNAPVIRLSEGPSASEIIVADRGAPGSRQ